LLRLERHHGVVIADDALDAAVRLTDEYVHDRARPDRAIDALDEACAHTQARASYRPALVALLAERRGLLRATASAAAPQSAPSLEQDEAEADPLGRFARSGFDALERFGAELEAAIVERLGDGGSRHPPRPGGAGGAPAHPQAPRAADVTEAAPRPAG